ncbi:MAG TPA: hypothetical protein VEC37_11675 [Bacillota bacterium]|nr:hypothetical protein [Bacillota bacterium]
MKKTLMLVLLLLCSSATVASAHNYDYSEHRHHKAGHREHRYQENSEERMRARRVLRYTSETLMQAQRAARRGGYREGLGRGFAHQDRAKELYYDGEYNRSIRHSLRAREIAEYIIDENRVEHHHHRGHHHSRRDDLDQGLSVKVVDDNVALKFRVDLD